MINSMLMEYHTWKTKYDLYKQYESDLPQSLLDFKMLCDCIDNLEGELQAVIIQIYVNKCSLRKCANKLHYSHNTILKLRNKAIDIITECFNLFNKS